MDDRPENERRNSIAAAHPEASDDLKRAADEIRDRRLRLENFAAVQAKADRIGEIADLYDVPRDYALAAVESVMGWQAEMGPERYERGDLKKARRYADKLAAELDAMGTQADLIRATGLASETASDRVVALLDSLDELRTLLHLAKPPHGAAKTEVSELVMALANLWEELDRPLNPTWDHERKRQNRNPVNNCACFIHDTVEAAMGAEAAGAVRHLLTK